MATVGVKGLKGSVVVDRVNICTAAPL